MVRIGSASSDSGLQSIFVNANEAISLQFFAKIKYEVVPMDLAKVSVDVSGVIFDSQC